MRTPVSYGGAFPLPRYASRAMNALIDPIIPVPCCYPLLPPARILYHAQGPSFESAFRCTITAHFSQACIMIRFPERSNAAVHVTATCSHGTSVRTSRSAALARVDLVC